MATVTGTLTLASTDLLSDAMSFSTQFTHTSTRNSTGLAREQVKSTAKGTASGQVTLYTADDYALYYGVDKSVLPITMPGYGSMNCAQKQNYLKPADNVVYGLLRRISFSIIQYFNDILNYIYR